MYCSTNIPLLLMTAFVLQGHIYQKLNEIISIHPSVSLSVWCCQELFSYPEARPGSGGDSANQTSCWPAEWRSTAALIPDNSERRPPPPSPAAASTSYSYSCTQTRDQTTRGFTLPARCFLYKNPVWLTTSVCVWAEPREQPESLPQNTCRPQGASEPGAALQRTAHTHTHTRLYWYNTQHRH